MNFTVNTDLGAMDFDELVAFVDAIRSIDGAVVEHMSIDDGILTLDIDIDPGAIPRHPSSSGPYRDPAVPPVADLLRMKQFLEDLSSFGPADRYRGKITDAIKKVDSFLLDDKTRTSGGDRNPSGDDGAATAHGCDCPDDGDGTQPTAGFEAFTIPEPSGNREEEERDIHPEDRIGERFGQMGQSVAHALGDVLDNLFGPADKPRTSPANPHPDGGKSREQSHSYGDFGSSPAPGRPEDTDGESDDARRIRRLMEQEEQRRRQARGDDDNPDDGKPAAESGS